MLTDYPGTVIVVSHDRDFLDRVATSTIVAEGQGVWVEYAGGYSDMVAQRGAGVGDALAKAMASAGKRAAPELPRAPTRTARLSFKQKHALETLPAVMEALQVKRAELQAQLADPALYKKDPARFAQVSKALAEAERKLAAAEEQWLELEMLRETLEG
jgi:ATP-binding cassette subfamily F protein uup